MYFRILVLAVSMDYQDFSAYFSYSPFVHRDIILHSSFPVEQNFGCKIIFSENQNQIFLDIFCNTYLLKCNIFI